MINTIILGNALIELPKLPSELVSCVVTSPPYWGLRDYGIEPVIWDGNKNCKHIWKKEITKRPNASGSKTDWAKEKLAIKGVENYQEYVDYHKRETKSDFCQICGAWKGNLGLEPTFELYVKHLCDIFDEIKRVLRKDGVCFVNMGDSYGGSGNASGHKEDTKNLGYKTLGMGASQGNQKTTRGHEKSLLDIPYRFSIEMINRGWIKRNTIIWHKPNCMPSSADDRFTIDFEYLFFFTKNNKAIFWTNEKTLECVSKSPLGIKGIEDKDWEWKESEQLLQKLTPKDFENEWEYRKYIRAGKEYNSKEPYKANAPGCRKLKRKKVSLWTGHDYWFEQQFEEQSSNTHFKGIKPKTTNKFKDKSRRADNKVSHKNWHEYTPKTILPNGRNKRCVWIIPTQPFPEAHFAVYPEGLIEIPIRAGCPEFVCKKCGKARVKILEPTEEYKKLLGKSWHPHKHDAERGMNETPDKKVSCTAEYNFKGYSDCGCNAGFEPGIILDPFIGSGTTAKEALKQRKRFIGIEIKQEYIDMAKRRIAKVQQRIF